MKEQLEQLKLRIDTVDANTRGELERILADLEELRDAEESDKASSRIQDAIDGLACLLNQDLRALGDAIDCLHDATS